MDVFYPYYLKHTHTHTHRTVLSPSSAAPAYDEHPGYYLTADSLRTPAIKSRIDYTQNWVTGFPSAFSPLWRSTRWKRDASSFEPTSSHCDSFAQCHPPSGTFRLSIDLLLVLLFSHFPRTSSFVEKMRPTAPQKYTNSLVCALKIINKRQTPEFLFSSSLQWII